jgi:XS zinc finger domain
MGLIKSNFLLYLVCQIISILSIPLMLKICRLKVNEINEQTRQWHCPACANGPGAIEWYKGLQPLMTHAKTKGSTRVKRHRELATLLEEELRLRGTSVIPVGEQYGKWQGLRQTTTDHEIVWPAMVVITNTFLDTDENDKVSFSLVCFLSLIMFFKVLSCIGDLRKLQWYSKTGFWC